MHSWWKTRDFSKIESGPNYTTAAHAFVKAPLRLRLRAPFVARNKHIKFVFLLTAENELKKPSAIFGVRNRRQVSNVSSITIEDVRNEIT